MASWKLLHCFGLNSKIIDLMETLCTDTMPCSCVNVDGVMSDWFAVGGRVRQGCRIAPDLFLGPTDHMMERTVHRGMTGVTLGDEIFTDLDFADDVALLAEMLEVLVLTLSVMEEEQQTLGFISTGLKPRLSSSCNPATCSTVQVAGGQVEVVDSFVYLGSTIDSSGGSRGEILRGIGLARSCMNLLEKNLEI